MTRDTRPVGSSELQESCRADYDKYEFHRVVQALQTFCSEDLGGFYLDILKDRLYTIAPKSVARRAAQSALWHITQALVRLLAPITSFTAEEVWAVLTGKADESVMFQLWHDLPKPEGEGELLAKWAIIRGVRNDVTKALEAQREAGKIGSALQAAVEVRCAGEKFAALAALGDDLKFVFIVSAASVVQHAEEQVLASPLSHDKSERGWHIREDVGADAAYPGICGRCVGNLHGEGEARRCA